MAITHPHAAGIDIGSASHYVAVPPDRDDNPVREFPGFTRDLHALADWLRVCKVDTVVMESTGVYWIPVFELLESLGFTVMLVNARHVKNVSLPTRISFTTALMTIQNELMMTGPPTAQGRIPEMLKRLRGRLVLELKTQRPGRKFDRVVKAVAQRYPEKRLSRNP